MRKFIDFLSRYVFPLATRLANWRWLVALRDAFISIIPISVIGSLAVLIPGLISAAKTMLGLKALAYALGPIVQISNLVYLGTFKLFSFFFVLAWGYQIAKNFEVNRLAGAIVALGSFCMSIANLVKVKIGNEQVVLHHVFNTSQLSSTGLFTGLIFGGLGAALYVLFYKGHLTLRFSNQIPHAEEAAFVSLIPVLLSLSIVGTVNYLFQTITGTYFGNWLLNSIQAPLMKMGQGFGMVLLITFLIHAFYFFGINGLSVLAPVLDSIWLTAQNSNISLAKAGKLPHYIWTRNSFDVFAFLGGSGATLLLIFAILLFSKRSDYRTLAKIAIGPGFFNVNEPIIWSLPIVLNPIYVIPFILAPMVNVSIAYFASAMHWINPIQATVPSVIPPILNAYLATAYDWRVIILIIINMVVSLLIWTPFVFAADRVRDESEHRSFFNYQY
ncbi:PTS sugar transporter subunit IIC [Lactobacillus psittaci]|uniref:Permease IIC component n=1 Tax=Lactobacillus psittaci DSM 15354 TaxID=1122152 RepID=A0A0R1S3L8_9LACO|nr:PTS transporter subunit EIIC [Lactobacillus psittaci]KRL63830.1 PTS system, cellobiose-specific IIC component [Lactobacillus psittaci DSM 15354]